MNTQELRALLAKATPGKWFAWESTNDGPTIQIPEGFLFGSAFMKGTMADAKLACALRNSIEPLLDRMERLEAVAEAVRFLPFSKHKDGTVFAVSGDADEAQRVYKALSNLDAKE